jgi:tetratricopeptide (TPR) repeat protein
MFTSFITRTKLRAFIAAMVIGLCSITTTVAQSSEDDIDPVKLFELGQDAHARGELDRALELYSKAIALHPDFPEAEYQRAVAYLSLGRAAESEKSLRRAIELRPEWAAPLALLGDALVRQKRFPDAEPLLLKALHFEPGNFVALIALAESRVRSKAPNDVLTKVFYQLRTATSLPKAPVDVWLARGSVELALGNKSAALTSFSHALVIDPRNVTALLERADILAGNGEVDAAIESAKAARQIAPSSIYVSTALARLYLQAGNCPEATRTLDEVDTVTKRPAETSSLRSVITLECATGDNERASLETALAKEPRNAPILARLCLSYRKDDPSRALEYCRRALEIQPSDVDYATNYAAALVQARRFEDAVRVLRQVIGVAPDKFVAHANLAISLYELKRFPEALVEYRWIRESKPETTATYFFIAVIHDKMGEFENALSAYQDFLSRADSQVFKLEIEKVNLRLPSLRNQIKLGQGAKKKPQKKT